MSKTNKIKEKFKITEEEKKRIEDYIVKLEHLVSDEELFKIVVTCIAETTNHDGARIFFPDQKYELNDKIVMLKSDGKVQYGRVNKIEPKGNFLINPSSTSIVLRYCELLHIEPIKGDWESMQGFSIRISAISSPEEYYKEKMSEFLTREEVVEKYTDVDHKEEIRTGILEQLQESGRIISDGNKWFVRSHIPPIAQDKIEAILGFISESHTPISVDDILSKVLNVSLSAYDVELWRFSLQHMLDKDKRFMRAEGGIIAWKLSPPQRESIITLEEDALASGGIKITSGLKHMLFYYHYKEWVKFLTYGDYEISGTIEEGSHWICGEDIHKWYLENNLSIGDQIHIRCPEQKNEGLRLYTDFETKELILPKDGVGGKKQIYNIRHLIYEFLMNYGYYCSTEDIKNGLEASRNLKIEGSSVRSVLLNNPHLFERISPSCSLWGLKGWDENDKVNRVNLTSLLLAIQEDELVYKIIEETEEPLLS